MMQNVVNSLITDRAGVYVDSTYGRGGHAGAILDELSVCGRLFGFDCDTEAIKCACVKHKRDSRFTAIHARFSEIKQEIHTRKPQIKVSGILADLGVSSPQLDEAERGFSFKHDGPLDMRMNRNEALSASDWLQTVGEGELESTLRTKGEERFSRRIAKAILARQNKSPIRSTRELAELIEDCVPTRERNKHPATRTFLAIRMHINRELEELEVFLPQCVELLRRGGRLVIITFHSVEDRLVKQFMRKATVGAPGPLDLPYRTSDYQPTLKIVGKAIRPDFQEVKNNRRARSALMRVAEKIS